MSFFNGSSRDARHDIDEVIRLMVELRHTLERLQGRLTKEDSALASLVSAQIARAHLLVDQAFVKFQGTARLIRVALEPNSDEDP